MQLKEWMLMKYIFGVDIGGTTIKMGLFEATGKLLKKWEIVTDTYDEGKNILKDIAKSIHMCITSRNIKRQQVIGIGMGVPGPIKSNGVCPSCANLGWKDENVKAKMAALSGIRTVVANDANTAALGESFVGGGAKNMVLITLGTGVGAGVIVDGKIVPGFNGAGGEVGHILVNPEETKPCGCGKMGHLEQYASASAIVRIAKAELEGYEGESLLKDVSDMTAKDIFKAARKGDEFAISIVETIGRHLGRTLSILAVILDPEMFVLGGGMSNAGDMLLETVIRHYKEYAFASCENTQITLATLGNDAGIYGAYSLVASRLHKKKENRYG